MKISPADLHDGSDYMPDEGLDVTGWPITTIVRGSVVVEEGRLVGDSWLGGHVARSRSPARNRRCATYRDD